MKRFIPAIWICMPESDPARERYKKNASRRMRMCLSEYNFQGDVFADTFDDR